MISLGRRNRPVLLGAAVLMVLIFLSFSFSSSSSSSLVNVAKNTVTESIHKADYGIGNSVAPANGAGLSEKANTEGGVDKGLLSGATIDQDKTSVEKKPSKQFVVGNDKVDTIAGSDASLKAKQDSIKKAESKDVPVDTYASSEESDEVATIKTGKKAAAEDKTDVKAKATAEDKTDVKAKAGVDDNTDVKVKANAKDTPSAKGAAGAVGDYEYVVMIDAGSTGSRVHIYSFDTSSSPPVLINEEFKMLKPGLSSFDTDTVGAAESLDPLLKLALETIPKDKQSCSPVAVKATAGLRLLGEKKSAAILKEVRRHLEEDYPFPVVEGEGISIMDGSDEGVYAWITTNYLLNNIGSSKKLSTAAVFDLGGGSTQIVFEPTDGETVIEGEHKYQIEFGGREFVLYQYSHLGYGLMQARNKVNALVLEAELEAKPESVTPLTAAQVKSKNVVAKATIENPCIPPGVNADNVIVELSTGDKYAVNFVTPKTGSESTLAGQCKLLTDSTLNKDLECESKSCSFNGVYQPSFKSQFSSVADMYVFSYFYDRLQPIGMPDSFTLKEMSDIMTSVCSGSHLWDQYFKQPEHIKELEDEPLWCLDLNFMVSLLHTGYDIPLNRELKTAKTIGGNELGWCLGASLPLLDKANWKCKVTKEF